MIEFEGKRYAIEPEESVLDCLLRHGVSVDFLCRGGLCQACVLRATAGQVPAGAQAGLRSSLKEQGVFLSCQCRPACDLEIERCEVTRTYASRILGVEELGERVLRVSLERPPDFEYRSGQFIHLVRPADALARAYSLASLADASVLELHVARQPLGQMSGWLERSAGEPVELRGPFGECFYRDDEPERPLLLAATGTGLAPLSGVLRTAARHAHRGAVTLIHGSPELSGLYFRRELESLVDALPRLNLIGSVLAEGAGQSVSGRFRISPVPLDELLFAEHPNLSQTRVYLSGNPELVQRLKKRAYLAGASLDRIHADPFAAAAPPP